MATPTQETVNALSHPPNLKPWEDASLTPPVRFQAYKEFVAQQLEGILEAVHRLDGDIVKQREIQLSTETKRWVSEGRWLKEASAEDLCKRVDYRFEVRKLLGKNFLGAEAWSYQGIDVGAEPPFPATLTRELLEATCPFHAPELIKDTHLLVLVPKIVKDEPFSALKLDELCATRTEYSGILIDSVYNGWKKEPWAAAPQSESAWILIPKSGPDQSKVSGDEHFGSKTIGEQQKVHDAHYAEYREVKTLELTTAVLLNFLVNNRRLLPDNLRCAEPSGMGGRVLVGCFDADGLLINIKDTDGRHGSIGRALARKL